LTTEPVIETATDLPALTDAGEIIAGLRRTIARGEAHWFAALLAAVREWPLPAEKVGDREYRYLVGGEAFDWLLLAERLLGEVEGMIPDAEADALLFHSALPLETAEDELQRLLGAKGAAHLNFYYGVRVEEGLQLAVEAAVEKERFARVWDNGKLDDEVFTRIYGATRLDLLARFREKKAVQPEALEAGADKISLAELNEFTYWLFKYRVNNCDPARVASDTRIGVGHLEGLRKRGQEPPP
jgi:hypothetical protein